MIHNPNFKVVEFDHFRMQAGLPSFVMSVSEWIEKTNAIGIIVKKGHQLISMVNFMPLFLLIFTKRLTSSVFSSVTIGMGDDIHIRNASARLLS